MQSDTFRFPFALSATWKMESAFGAVLGIILIAIPVSVWAVPVCKPCPIGWDEIRAVLAADQEGNLRIEVAGLPESSRSKEPGTIVQVWLGGPPPISTPPILGKTNWEGDLLVFHPRFKLIEGQSYLVRVDDGTNQTTDFKLELKQSSVEPTVVNAIFPSGSLVPENTLRFYVHFSQPMQQGDIYQFVKILNESGKPVELPFLEIEQELWSRDGRRLTLLLDPGRIKRGLKPREEMGPIFVAGNRYQLSIDGGWPDANGLSLGADVIKRFSVGPEDHIQPNPADWKLDLPTPDTRQPLRISWGNPLDQAMLLRVVSLHTAGGDQLEGSVKLGADETSWSFVPAARWQPGKYEVRIDNRLEDLAGNSIEKLFDVDVFNKTEPVLSGYTTLNIAIESADQSIHYD